MKIICCFVVKCYVEFRFRSTNIIEAPYNNILFLKILENFKTDDKEVAEKAIKKKKYINHIWYLSAKISTLSLFDYEFGSEVKCPMAIRILETLEDEYITVRNRHLKKKI